MTQNPRLDLHIVLVHPEVPPNTGNARRLAANTGERSGKLVCEAVDVTYAWDARPIIRGFSTTILRGDRIGIGILSQLDVVLVCCRVCSYCKQIIAGIIRVEGASNSWLTYRHINKLQLFYYNEHNYLDDLFRSFG